MNRAKSCRCQYNLAVLVFTFVEDSFSGRRHPDPKRSAAALRISCVRGGHKPLRKVISIGATSTQ